MRHLAQVVTICKSHDYIAIKTVEHCSPVIFIYLNESFVDMHVYDLFTIKL